MNDKFDFPPFGPSEQQPNGPVPAPPELPARKRRGGRRAAAPAKPAAKKRPGRPPKATSIPLEPAPRKDEIELELVFSALNALRQLSPATRKRILALI